MWACPKCGEQIEDQFEACWSCGTRQDGTDPDESFQEAADGRVPEKTPLTKVCPKCNGEMAQGFLPDQTDSKSRVVQRWAEEDQHAD